MRVFFSLFLAVTVFTASLFVAANEIPKQKYDYQSDVARLRKIVINSLYSHRDVFLRELISNANDALEKLRLTALTDQAVLEGAEQLNVTIKAFKDEQDGKNKIVITDTGIGMTAEELTSHLGTLAKSGTSEFLSKAESSDGANTGNLIGAFGVGFYSSFLVADKVNVASVAAKSAQNPEPKQYVFTSSSEESTFEVFPDPRGNTLGRGTEITLFLKDDANEYVDTDKLTQLIQKHSSFSSQFPIYLFTQRTEEVPDEEVASSDAESSTTSASTEETTSPVSDDDEEAIVEEVSDDAEPKKEEEKETKMKSVVVDEWVKMNPQAPLWMRDPKTVTDEEYELFYHATFKDYEKPLAWHHFSGDTGSGTSFRAIIYIPSRLDDSFWQVSQSTSKDFRLMVKRVFITNDLGEDALPKWASWVKVVVDAEDLPLNVSRETLQSTKFLKQLKGVIVRRLIQVLTKIQDEDPEKFAKISKVYNNVVKLGAVEDTKNRDKLATLARFPTNQRNNTSLDGYLENKKQGQKQIFYLADMGQEAENLAKSVFVEKLHARGYEVLLMGQPLDEIFVQNLRAWKKYPFQDVAKAGLKFGDEDDDEETMNALSEKYRPLLDWLKKEAEDIVRDVIVSNRLVASSCAIVADTYGYTANIEKMLSSSQDARKAAGGMLHDFHKKQKLLEINPRSPLIEGLLKRVKQLPSEEEERDLDAEDELREVTTVLIDGALVRSGFGVPDSNAFFARVDRILRRSLGVSETARTDTTVKPAPPVDPKIEEDSAEEEEEENLVNVNVPPQVPLKENKPQQQEQYRWEVEEIDEDGNVINIVQPETVSHDEL
ncbi:cation-transporting ATPase [Abortiporus biennis]|nr:cation-transporting ATPase [Abortiporus biennis]